MADSSPHGPVLSSRIAPDASVSGANILTMLAAMGPFRKRGELLLEEQGIAGVSAEGWYPLRAYAQTLRAIGEKMGPNTLFQIGRQIPTHMALPPGLDTFQKVLASLGQTFDASHRGVSPNTIEYGLQTGRHATIITGTPYPCDFDRGMIAGFLQHLLRVRADIQNVEREPCKSRGGETCMYSVTLPAM